MKRWIAWVFLATGGCPHGLFRTGGTGTSGCEGYCQQRSDCDRHPARMPNTVRTSTRRAQVIQAATNSRSATGSRPCLACQRLSGICRFSQQLGLPPKAADIRNAISAGMPSRPVSRSESELHETPNPIAASVTVDRRSSRHRHRKKAPGGADRAWAWAWALPMLWSS